MNLFFTILIAILIFGGLIFIHELGHYLTARLFDVHILEFSIGMGPKVLSRKSKKTGIVYSLRLLPFGGFVSMVGEDDEGFLLEDDTPASTGGAGSFSLPARGEKDADEESFAENSADPSAEADASDKSAPRIDPRALCRKPVWQRMIITAAGGVMNLLLGVVMAAALVISMPVMSGTMVGEFNEGALSQEQGLQIGDVITHVNGKSVVSGMDLYYAISHDGNEPVDITLRRGAEIKRDEEGMMISYSGGEEIKLKDVTFGTEEEQGIIMGSQDFKVFRVKKTFGNIVVQSGSYARLAIREVWDGLTDLLTGRYGMEQMSGPVGVTEQIGVAVSYGVENVLFLVLVITMNLGLFNLLPIPALDGGRLVFQLIELIFRKRVPPEIEGKIHFVFLALLMLLMLVITGKDVIGLFK